MGKRKTKTLRIFLENFSKRLWNFARILS